MENEDENSAKSLFLLTHICSEKVDVFSALGETEREKVRERERERERDKLDVSSA